MLTFGSVLLDAVHFVDDGLDQRFDDRVHLGIDGLVDDALNPRVHEIEAGNGDCLTIKLPFTI